MPHDGAIETSVIPERLYENLREDPSVIATNIPEKLGYQGDLEWRKQVAHDWITFFASQPDVVSQVAEDYPQLIWKGRYGDKPGIAGMEERIQTYETRENLESAAQERMILQWFTENVDDEGNPDFEAIAPKFIEKEVLQQANKNPGDVLFTLESFQQRRIRSNQLFDKIPQVRMIRVDNPSFILAATPTQLEQLQKDLVSGEVVGGVEYPENTKGEDSVRYKSPATGFEVLVAPHNFEYESTDFVCDPFPAEASSQTTGFTTLLNNVPTTDYQWSTSDKRPGVQVFVDYFLKNHIGFLLNDLKSGVVYAYHLVKPQGE